MTDPRHIAIIMDGNGRWANQRRRPRLYGHIKGARVAKKIITHCVQKGLEALTLYAFSSENWLRPKQEVQFLMFLLQRYLKREVKTLVRQNVKFNVIGDKSKLPPEVLSVVEYTEQQTARCTGLKLTFAISYGARDELTSAFKALIKKVQEGDLNIDDVDESIINNQLWTSSIPDPDLIIRTSGEQRLSNFMLWQAAYSEFYFTTILWPDFTTLDLDVAIVDYLKRSRRFGNLNNELSHH